MLGEPKFKTVREIVSWMGAMQAQDYAMAKWGIGVRLPVVVDADVEAAVASGVILRTHLLRPTWHFVAAEDIYWLLALTGPNIRASMNSRHNGLGLTDEAVAKSSRVIENAVGLAGSMTREELVEKLKEAGFAAEDNRMAHLLMLAELDGILCSGPSHAGKPTYSLLKERVPEARVLPHDDALAVLAGKYFASRGPATLKDFVWWSGLPIGDARLALQAAGNALSSEKIGDQTVWFSSSFAGGDSGSRRVILLPAFDELIIGYQDRSPTLPFEHFKKTVSSNGVFRPVVVVDGRVVGIWSREIHGEKVAVKAQLFIPLEERMREGMETAAQEYGRFLGKAEELQF